MAFIVLTFDKTGPTRCNVDHIIRYYPHLSGGSWVITASGDGATGFVVLEEPEKIDELLGFAGTTVCTGV